MLLIAAYILAVIGAANLAEQRRRLSPLLAMLTFGLVYISGLWRWCAIAVRRLSFGGAPSFDPEKPVHRAAAFLMLLGILNILLKHLAGDSAAYAIALPDAVIDLLGIGALHLAAALLGVGWLVRRRLPDVGRRLCLPRPTLREALNSIAIGAGLWILATAAVTIWEHRTPADVFMQQTEPARQYFQVFSGSIAAALLLAVIPALSEEILYRGALQPVFGVFLSSLFFTAVHLQYALTPALLILFGVSLGFAWLRWRFHTSAAIIAHAIYNFLPFLAGT